MSAADLCVGYPVHAVAEYSERTNPHGVRLTDWKAACGTTGTAVGTNPFGLSGSARKRELCRSCWPAGHGTYQPKPKVVQPS